MRERNRLRAWGPWIISVVSLFVALSSTAVAINGKNTVDSGDIKPHAVKTQDLANGAVKNPNLGQGAINAGTIGHYTVISDNLGEGSVAAHSLATLKIAYGPFQSLGQGETLLSATCPTATKLISGGASKGGEVIITSSYPDVTLPGNNPKKWYATAELQSGSGFASAYALCLAQ